MAETEKEYAENTLTAKPTEARSGDEKYAWQVSLLFMLKVIQHEVWKIGAVTFQHMFACIFTIYVACRRGYGCLKLTTEGDSQLSSLTDQQKKFLKRSSGEWLRVLVGYISLALLVWVGILKRDNNVRSGDATPQVPLTQSEVAAGNVTNETVIGQDLLTEACVLPEMNQLPLFRKKTSLAKVDPRYPSFDATVRSIHDATVQVSVFGLVDTSVQCFPTMQPHRLGVSFNCFAGTSTSMQMTLSDQLTKTRIAWVNYSRSGHAESMSDVTEELDKFQQREARLKQLKAELTDAFSAFQNSIVDKILRSRINLLIGYADRQLNTEEAVLARQEAELLATLNGRNRFQLKGNEQQAYETLASFTHTQKATVNLYKNGRSYLRYVHMRLSDVSIDDAAHVLETVLADCEQATSTLKSDRETVNSWPDVDLGAERVKTLAKGWRPEF